MDVRLSEKDSNKSRAISLSYFLVIRSPKAFNCLSMLAPVSRINMIMRYAYNKMDGLSRRIIRIKICHTRKSLTPHN